MHKTHLCARRRDKSTFMQINVVWRPGMASHEAARWPRVAPPHPTPSASLLNPAFTTPFPTHTIPAFSPSLSPTSSRAPFTVPALFPPCLLLVPFQSPSRYCLYPASTHHHLVLPLFRILLPPCPHQVTTLTLLPPPCFHSPLP